MRSPSSALHRFVVSAGLVLAGWSAAGSAPAQQAEPEAVTIDAPAPSASQPSTRPAAEPTEPDVHHAVIEDEGVRIDELRVRGQIQRITVTPKVGPKKGYEIVTGDGSRDTSDGAFSQRGAIGKSVWHVLSF